MNARWVEPVSLEGRLARLDPLSLDHLADLTDAARDPAVWRWMPNQPRDAADVRRWIEVAVERADGGSEMPFATIDSGSGRAVGSTRFLAIVPEHRRLEIGWTWLAPAAQRSGLNREAKLLMLEHAFESLGANRVEFKTDSLNARSRAALLGIGASFEGIFRDHMVMPDGRLRHSAYYSIVAHEWPAVRRRLQAAIHR